MNGSPQLTEEMVKDFRYFVEWILGLDLTETQEDRLRRVLMDLWSHNDKVSMDLVNSTLEIFGEIKKASEETRNSWREQNRPVFLAFLRKDRAHPLARSLLEAYAGLAASGTPQDHAAASPSGPLGLLGGHVLSTGMGQANESMVATGMGSELSGEHGDSLSASGNYESVVSRMLEEQRNKREKLRKEQKELMDTNPQAAEAKKREYEAMERENEENNKRMLEQLMQRNQGALDIARNIR